ncbi:MAG: 3-deoxy-manno-octulosonate cytidylyltransferase [Geminicoccaceae bacterium]|nr:3-deoxy-manno-octulosonate cytidylyltransferase [Geminicoccaceae bacterium]MCS7268670.1 3-deoxy-manno-octulosonate cytidylyltransferase [Geminicoccaceae bacterium]MDW8341477.1 3-deoxy-manno-octulosonate cytidylyltransferase [Geminicoccaceae bacterium]
MTSEPASRDTRSRTIVLIPARLAATRLPGKPLAAIAGEPMIVHVWRRAVEADLGRVVVAAADPPIAEAVARAGGEAVVVPDELPSGTDRIFRALLRLDPERRFARIVNLQGDLPTIDPADLARVVEPLERLGCDLSTLAVESADPEDRARFQVVKVIPSFLPEDPTLARALYFTRAPAPWGEGPIWHHIGVYAFTRAALERFCALAPSPLERREKLEQLRALEAGMTIGVKLVASAPFGVDTPEDLERARRVLEARLAVRFADP